MGWNWDAPSPSGTRGSRGGLGVTGGRDAASDVDGRQVGGCGASSSASGPREDEPPSDRGRAAQGARRRRARAPGATTAAAAAAANDCAGTSGVRTQRGPGGMNLRQRQAGAAGVIDGGDLDSPEQHQTHDVIITEIEEIGLTDCSRLQAPTFGEEAPAHGAGWR